LQWNAEIYDGAITAHPIGFFAPPKAVNSSLRLGAHRNRADALAFVDQIGNNSMFPELEVLGPQANKFRPP
jgi:hypothetical protein